MAHKVFLSPSDQKLNTYAAGNTNEAEQCGKIAHAAKAALDRCGFETMLVQYESMASKCANLTLLEQSFMCQFIVMATMHLLLERA